MTRLGRAGGTVTITLIVTVLISCGGNAQPEKNARIVTSTTAPNAPIAVARPRPAPRVPARLTAVGLGLRAGPVAVPLLLQIPTLNINAPMVGVGITTGNAMDAPEGPLGDPVWQQAFWYRGSAIPGARSTALIAGHIDGPHGSSAVFGHIDTLRPGDPIVVHDTRTGLDVRFAVTSSRTYSLAQAAEPAVLKRIYGVGPVVGKWPQPSADGLAHLTLITCAGTFRNGTHDHRLAVFADRVS